MEEKDKDELDLNPYYQGAAGALGIYSDISNRINNAKAISTRVSAIQQDAYGRPSYSLGSDFSRLSSLDPSSYSKGAALSGAATGAAAGTQIAPGIGTLIGGAIGGIAGAIGGGVAKRKAEERQRQLQTNLTAKQNQFNSLNLSASNRDLAQAEYFDSLGDRQTRMIAGLYGIPR